VELTLADAADGALRVLGKGNKERRVPINRALRAALATWLLVRGDAPGPLLYRADKSARLLVGRPMRGGAVYAALHKLARRAGTPRLGPHDCRRTFATFLIDAGVDFKTVARLMGHASIATTERYDHRSEDAARAAVEKLTYAEAT
jgi:integrase